MKRLLQRICPAAASLSRAISLLLTLLALDARAGNFCHNPVPACDPTVLTDPPSACYNPPPPTPVCEPTKLCDKCTRSPCYVGSGVYTTEEIDLEIGTTGFPITVSRLYQSSRAIDGESGYGWVSGLSARLYYTDRLKAAPDSFRGDDLEAHVRLPNGTLYRFVENADGTYAPPAGRFDTLVRNPDGTWDLRLQRTRSHLHFSATGNLLQLVDDYGNITEWTYAKDRLARVADISGSGRYIDITWGADGRLSDVTDMTGRNVHYVYNGGALVSVTNAAGQTTSYGRTAGKYGPLLNTITDHWGRLATTVTFDTLDRVKSYTERGEIFSYSYTAGLTTKSDSAGNTWQYPFVEGGLVTENRPPGGGSTDHTDFDSNGLVRLHTDATGVKTHYSYDDRGNVLARTLDYQAANAVEWRFVYDAAFPDKATSVTAYYPGTNDVHPDWQAQKFDYYPPGSIAPGAVHHVYEVDNDGVTSRAMRTYTYDSHGRPLSETLGDGGMLSFAYDARGNLESVTGPANNDAGVRPVTAYTYDPLGRRETSTDAEGNVTTYAWDTVDRLVSRTEPIPSGASSLTFTTITHYDEFETTTQLLSERTVDPNGATVVFSRDAYGQVVQQSDPGGLLVQFTWEKGLLKSRRDSNNYATLYSYDARRRLTTITYPDSTFEEYTYLGNDEIDRFRDRAGTVVTYAYDPFKRMTSASYPTGAKTTWTYAGQKLMSVTDTRPNSAGTLTQAWNATFRIESETQQNIGTVAWTYDPEGRKRTETIDGATTTTYSYYPDGSLRTIDWSPVTGAFVHEYDLTGRLTKIQFPNEQTRTWAHDGQGRVVSVANVHPSGNLAAFTYDYDVDPFTGANADLGFMTKSTAWFPAFSMTGAVTKFDYDGRGMLIRADYPGGAPFNGLQAAWVFDAAGNRSSATSNGNTSTYTYRKYGNNLLNGSVLLSDGGSSYTYDGAGSTLTRSGARGNYTFTWDADHRLSSVSGDEAESYRYDTINRRTAITTTAGTTSYLYSDFQPVVESGASSAQYLFTGGLDHPLAMIRGGQVYYYAVDGLGSVVAVNDASGAVVDSYAYDAWGVTVARNETVPNSFGFAARPRAAAGLADHRFRSYEAATGSFRSVDPLIATAGRALAMKVTVPTRELPAYGYVGARPTMFTDPFGLDPACVNNCSAAWNRQNTRCWEAFEDGLYQCSITLSVCALRVKNPWFAPGCLAVAAACFRKEGRAHKRCQVEAVRAFEECMLGCGYCVSAPVGLAPKCERGYCHRKNPDQV